MVQLMLITPHTTMVLIASIGAVVAMGTIVWFRNHVVLRNVVASSSTTCTLT